MFIKASIEIIRGIYMYYLRVKSVAERLDVSKSTVWRLVQQGILPKPIKLSSRTTVWKSDDIDAAIEKRGRAA
jgi:predicted DNA-binding transcriptional regulator AlpA